MFCELGNFQVRGVQKRRDFPIFIFKINKLRELGTGRGTWNWSSNLAMPNLETFADRLRHVLGDESVNSFAKKCGMGESKIRSYLNGSLPGIDAAATIARASGYELKWLATGDGPMWPGDSSAPMPAAPEPPAPPDPPMPALDHDFGGEVCAAVLELYRSENARLSTARIVAIALEKYEEIVQSADTLEGRRAVLSYVLSQLRKDLRSGTAATTQGKRSA